MTFEELPPAVQDFLRHKSDGEYFFPGVGQSQESDYSVFAQIERSGLLTDIEAIQPPDSWAYETPVPKIGHGKGFSAWPERFVVPWVDESLAEADPSQYPLDATLDFYAPRGVDYYCVSQTVFSLLKDLGCAADGMWADVYFQMDTTIERSNWVFIDFPKHPIVDYARSACSWSIFTLSGSGIKVYVPYLAYPSRPIQILPGRVFPPIVRDKEIIGAPFVQKAILSELRRAGVKGPKYG